VIPAVEALQLPGAALSAEEREAADKLELAIEAHVRSKMTRQGVTFVTEETRGEVIADVNQRLKAAGYQSQWTAQVEQHPLNKALQRVVGFSLSLAPTDESYRNAARAALL
jgi:uncharacterized protein YcbX